MIRSPLHRSEQSHRAIGDTEISPRAARVFVALMAVALFVVSAVEVATAWRPAAAGWRGTGNARGLLAANTALRESLHAFEDRLREEAWLTRTLVPTLQRFKVERLRLGNESVLVGRDGWLHYAQDFALLTDRLPQKQIDSARRAIRHFAQQLEARGIRLVLVPAPAKTAFTAEMLVPRAARSPIRRKDHEAFWRGLEGEGVRVFDPSSAWSSLLPGELYLRADTHWTFDAMDRAAAALASELSRTLGLSSAATARFARDEEAVADLGDLARMLGDGLPASWRNAQTQILRVVRDGEFAWRPARGAPVLLLGDSFSNIYSQEGLGWGGGAGFAEQLSFYLGIPIDRIVRNDAGAWATRDLLARELARGRDRLEGVRVVVWQFAERELLHGDWRQIELNLGAAAPADLCVPPSRSSIWTGTVAAVSAIPAPGRVPYADHIAAFHLVDVEGPGASANEAYVFAWSMTNHQRAAAGRLRPGDRARFMVRDWAEVADRLEGVNRSEVEDDRFLAADWIWAEYIP